MNTNYIKLFYFKHNSAVDKRLHNVSILQLILSNMPTFIDVSFFLLPDNIYHVFSNQGKFFGSGPQSEDVAASSSKISTGDKK